MHRTGVDKVLPSLSAASSIDDGLIIGASSPTQARFDGPYGGGVEFGGPVGGGAGGGGGGDGDDQRIFSLNGGPSSASLEDDSIAAEVRLLDSALDDTRLSRRETCVGAAARFTHSRAFTAAYVTLIVLNVVAVIWAIADKYPHTASFLALEIFINLALCAEIGIRMATEGLRFWKSRSNVFDLIVVAFCVVVLVAYAASTSGSDDAPELVAIVLLVLRNTFQLVRLFVMLKNQRRRERHRNVSLAMPAPVGGRRRNDNLFGIDDDDDDRDDNRL